MVNEDLLAQGKARTDAVLLDTNSFYLDEDVCRDITKFVCNGGVFVGGHLTGVNRFDGGEDYALYRKHFGVEIPATDVTGKVTFGKRSLVEQTGFAIRPRTGDTILARWSDGRAAAIKRRIGKGCVIVFGFPIQAVLEEALNHAGVRRRLITTATEAGLAQNEKGDYFITLLNSRVIPVRVKVQLNGLSPDASYCVRDLVRQKDLTLKADSFGSLRFATPVDGTKCSFLTVTNMPKK